MYVCLNTGDFFFFFKLPLMVSDLRGQFEMVYTVLGLIGLSGYWALGVALFFVL